MLLFSGKRSKHSKWTIRKTKTIFLGDFALPLFGYQEKAQNFWHITRAFNLTQIIC